MLPAATAPADIVLAARHVRAAGEDRSQIEHRSWDESVKSLTHYPSVLLWMDENLQWAKQVGEAFGEQPVAVMQAIQRLRARARAAGTLVDTPEQSVLGEAEVIRIVPAQPDILYVPSYDWNYAYALQPLGNPRPFLTFGAGWPVGAWLAFDCDWRRHTIWVGNRHRRWHGHDWRQPVVPIPAVAHPYGTQRDVRPWRPAERPGRASGPATPPRGPAEFARAIPPRPASPSTPASPVARPSHGFHGDRGNRPFVPVSRGTPEPPGTIAPSFPPPATPASPPPAVIPSTRNPRPASRHSPDRPPSNAAAPDLGPGTRPTPAPFARPHPSPPTDASNATGSRPRDVGPSRQFADRPTPATTTRSAPPPASTRGTPPSPSTVSAPVPASPPPQSAAPSRTEGDGERSIGRRPPNEHQR
jgi:hypothetical protein